MAYSFDEALHELKFALATDTIIKYLDSLSVGLTEHYLFKNSCLATDHKVIINYSRRSSNVEL